MASSNLAIIVKMVDQASGPLKAVESSVHGLTGALGSVATAAAGIAGGLFAFDALGKTVGFVKDAAFGLNSELQQNTIAFTTMLGSAAAAQKHLDELAKFAAATPFEFKDVVTASKRLQAMGISAKDVVPTLTAVGNAAAAVGGGAQTIERVTTAIGQMNAKGKTSAEEMKQLTEAGIPVWDMLAKKLNTDVAGAMEMVSKGAVSSGTTIDAFREGVAQRFGGMMAAQSKTWEGAISTLKDTLSMAIAQGFKPFFDAATNGVNNLNDALSNPAFKAFVDETATKMADLASKLTRWLTNTAESAQKWWPLVVRAFAAIRKEADELNDRVKTALAPTFEKLEPVVTKIKDAFHTFSVVMNRLLANDSIGLVHYALMEIFGIDSGKLVEGFDKVKKVAGELADKVSGFLKPAFDNAEKSFKTALPSIDDVKGALNGVYLIVKDLVTNGDVGVFADNMKELFGIDVTPGIKAIESFKNEVVTAFEEISTTVGKVVGVMTPVVQGGLSTIKGLWDRHGTETKTAVSSAYGVVGVSMGDRIKAATSIIDTTLNSIQKAWDTHGDAISRKVGVIWEGINQVISAVLTVVVPFVVGQFQKIRDWVDENWPLIQQTITTVLTFILGVVDRVLGAILTFWTDHGDAIMRVVTNVWNIISTVIDTAITVILGIIKTIMLIINGDWAGAWNEFQKIVTTVWDAMLKIISSVVDTVITIIWDLIKSLGRLAWDIFTAALVLGGKLLKGIIDAIATLVDDVIKIVVNVITAINNKAGEFLTAALNLGKKILTGITDGIKTLVDDVKGKLQGALDEVIGFGGRFFDQAKSLGGKLIDGMVNGVSSIASSVSTAISNALNALSIDVGPFHIDKNGIQIRWQGGSSGGDQGGTPEGQSVGGRPVMLGGLSMASASATGVGFAAGTVINWNGNIIINGAATPRETAVQVRTELLRMSRRTGTLGLL